MRTPAVEQAMERDRAYFVAHPDHRYYDRPRLPGGFGEGGGSGTVRVTQIGLGLRSRKLIAGALDIPTCDEIGAGHDARVAAVRNPQSRVVVDDPPRSLSDLSDSAAQEGHDIARNHVHQSLPVHHHL